MNARRTDQFWLIGGLAVIAVLIAASWFLLINPQYAEEDQTRANTQDTAAQLAKARSGFSALQAETRKLDEYEDQLAEFQDALPVTSRTKGIPEFLKQLQTLGTKLDVEVSGYSASSEIDSKAVPSVKELPITLNIGGTRVENISKFLRQLQNVQPRAVLIKNATLATVEGTTTVTVTLNAYVTSTVTEKVS
jgi:Tfp pilus assembly protein PilO